MNGESIVLVTLFFSVHGWGLAPTSRSTGWAPLGASLRNYISTSTRKIRKRRSLASSHSVRTGFTGKSGLLTPTT